MMIEAVRTSETSVYFHEIILYPRKLSLHKYKDRNFCCLMLFCNTYTSIIFTYKIRL
jgi:hypothetical protein